MRSEWQTARIEDVAEKVAMGPFGSSIKVETFVPSGVPIISGQHLHGIKLDEARGFNFITEEHAARLRNANVQRGDVIFTHAGNIGQVSYVPLDSKRDRYVISQRQFYMRCNRKRVIPEFVVYWFRTPEGQHKLLANKSQVGVPSIAQPVSYLRTVEIPLPTLPEQRAIAHVLGTLDDKIELNRRMNETLETMAQALFKSWFVDFDPVKAKIKGRQPAGIEAGTAELFPDSFEDSALGKVPRGWTVQTLGDICELAYGKALKQSIRRSGNVPVYGSNGQVGWHDKALVKGPGIVVGRKGNPGIATWSPTEFYPIDTTFYVVPRGPVNSFYYLLHMLSMQNLGSLGADSAVPGLNRNLAYMTKVIIPPAELLAAFDLQIKNTYGKRYTNNMESQTLGAIRDALLPKLISGELWTRTPIRKETGRAT